MRICLAFLTIVIVAGSLCISFAQSDTKPSIVDPKPKSLPQSGPVSECQISLSLKWIEFRDDPTNVEVKKLLEILSDDEPFAGDQAAGRNPTTFQTNPITNRTKEILTLTDELLKQSETKLLVDHKATLVNGREKQIYIGDAIDLAASEKAGKLIYIAKTENGSFSSAQGDILTRPNVQFVGTSIRATAEAQDENLVKLSVFAEASTVLAEPLIAGIPSLEKLAINTNFELRSGQSFVLFWLRLSRNISTDATVKNEGVQTVCVMTPEIIRPSDKSPKLRRPENK